MTATKLGRKMWRVILSERRDPPRIPMGQCAVAGLLGLVAALVVCLQATSVSARPSPLVNRLLNNHSYKVRLQAAIYLGKLRDPKTLAPLIKCLKRDRHYLVRALCATALGKLGNAAALPALKRRLRDKMKFVRGRVKQAIENIKAQSLRLNERRRGSGYQIKFKRLARAFVIVKPVKRRRGYLPKRVSRFVHRIIRLKLNKIPRLEVALNVARVPKIWLSRRRLKAYTLHTTLVGVRRRRRGRKVSVTANIRATVTRYPGGAVRFMVAAEARSSQAVKNRRVHRRELEALFRFLERQAAEGAVARVAKRISRPLGL